MLSFYPQTAHIWYGGPKFLFEYLSKKILIHFGGQKIKKLKNI